MRSGRLQLHLQLRHLHNLRQQRLRRRVRRIARVRVQSFLVHRVLVLLRLELHSLHRVRWRPPHLAVHSRAHVATIAEESTIEADVAARRDDAAQ
jgi:hypothetical protein